MPARERCEEGLEISISSVQRFGGVMVQDHGDFLVELSVLAVQGHHRDADHGEDESQPVTCSRR